MKNNYRKIIVLCLLFWVAFVFDRLIKMNEIKENMQTLKYKLLINLHNEKDIDKTKGIMINTYSNLNPHQSRVHGLGQVND